MTAHRSKQITDQAREKALREAVLPHVADLVTALVNQGMSREKALETIRWATYRLTKPEPDMEAPPRNPAGDVFGKDKALRVVR